MSTYIIGDIQGCYAALCQLLEKISFSPDTDQLYFLGNLVNRGPNSLPVLRFIRSLPCARVVLGNSAMLFANLSRTELEEYAVTIFSFLVMTGAHSYHEVMVVANTMGVSYQPGDYMQLLPTEFLQTTSYLQLQQEFPEFLFLNGWRLQQP